MLLMVEKGIREGYVMQFIDMQKLIANILKVMIKTKNHHILNTGMYIIYMVRKCRKGFQ